MFGSEWNWYTVPAKEILIVLMGDFIELCWLMEHIISMSMYQYQYVGPSSWSAVLNSCPGYVSLWSSDLRVAYHSWLMLPTSKDISAFSLSGSVSDLSLYLMSILCVCVAFSLLARAPVCLPATLAVNANPGQPMDTESMTACLVCVCVCVRVSCCSTSRRAYKEISHTGSHY